MAPEDSQSEARHWSDRARTLRWEGRLDEACQAARTAIEIAPELPDGWFNLGAVRIELGETADGLKAYRQALELNPNFAEAWSNLGEVLVAQGDRRGGIEAYRRGIAANPALAPIWSNLGGALLEDNQIAEAVSACRRAVELSPDFATGWSNLGSALKESGQHEEAVAACERALALAPDLANAWSNLGGALLESGESERALAAHRRALELAPQDARVHYNLGIAEERRLDCPAAIDSYRRAVALDSTLAAAHLRLACVLLMTGAFSEGWTEYEWRWSDRAAVSRRYDFTSWAGEFVPGRRLLLWGEQGIGDEILHASQVEEIARAGLNVTLEVDPRLVGLMQRSIAGIRVVPRREQPAIDVAAFDCQSPLASLGRWLRPSFHAFPSRRGYLKADAGRVESFISRLRAGSNDRVIGVSWSSSNAEFGQHKTTQLTEWAGMLRSAGAKFIDLQYGDTAEQRSKLRDRLGIDIGHLDDLDLHNDLEGLAALCAACDLVITVSNVTAHVAGALGVPVWLLAPKGNGGLWCWFKDRQDSPWYPSMRIFRQQIPGVWRDVFEQVEREFAGFTAR